MSDGSGAGGTGTDDRPRRRSWLWLLLLLLFLLVLAGGAAILVFVAPSARNLGKTETVASGAAPVAPPPAAVPSSPATGGQSSGAVAPASRSAPAGSPAAHDATVKRSLPETARQGEELLDAVRNPALPPLPPLGKVPTAGRTPVFVGVTDFSGISGSNCFQVSAATSTGFWRDLRRRIELQVNASERFYVYQPDAAGKAALPDDLLLLVTTVADLSVSRYQTAIGELCFYRAACTFSLVSPISGQVLFSDTLFSRERAAGGPPDAAARQEAFARIISTNLADFTAKNLASWRADRLACEAFFVLPDRVFLNKGRRSGIFPNDRVFSRRTRRVALVSESHDEYAIAVFASKKGEPPLKWEEFCAYAATSGAANHASVAGVTRVLWGEETLRDPRSAAFAEDERRLAHGLADPFAKDAGFPFIQAMLAQTATEKLAEGQRMRLVFPVVGLRSVNASKAAMARELHIAMERDDLFFSESFTRPDYGIALFLGALHSSETAITGGRETTYHLSAAAMLYDFSSGEILCAGRADASRSTGKKYSEYVGADGEVVQKMASPELFLQDLTQGAVALAAQDLAARYRTETVKGRVDGLDAGGNVLLSFASSRGIAAGRLLPTVSPVKAEMRLRQDAPPVSITTKSGAVIITAVEDAKARGLWIGLPDGLGGWTAPKAGDEVLIPGVPTAPGRQYARMAKADVAATHPASPGLMGPGAIRDLVFCAAAADPHFRMVFPSAEEAKLRAFAKVKYGHSFDPIAGIYEEDEREFFKDFLKGTSGGALVSVLRSPPCSLVYEIRAADCAVTGTHPDGTRDIALQVDGELSLRDEHGRACFRPLALPHRRDSRIGRNDAPGPYLLDREICSLAAKLVETMGRKRIAGE